MSYTQGACPKAECGSSDAFTVYDDNPGWGHCYSCGANVKLDANASPTPPKKKSPKHPLPIPTEYSGLRKISQKTMEKMKYAKGQYEGETAYLVAVPDGDGKNIVATKVRLAQKQFRFVGDTKNCGLVFQNIWQSGGKKVVVTEGEYDALSVSQAQDNKWPVVSVPNGADSAKAACQRAFKWLNSFEEIVLWFDADGPGQSAAEQVANLFPIGKVKIVRNPDGCKDANDLLKAGKVKDIVDCIWRAVPYTPARFVSFGSLKEEVLKPIEPGLPWVFDELTEWTYGRRPGETYFFGAGTGVGKTDFFTQQAAADIARGEKVALFSFEQSPSDTAKRLAGKFAGQRFHIPGAGWTPTQLSVAFDELDKTGSFIYDHWGSADWDIVSEDITVLAHSGFQHFYLDHLTAFAAHADDERKEIEGLCADLAELGQKLGINLYVISHLSTPDGTPHEEGGRVFVKHFKGSRAIGYWAHFMFGIERNTQAENEEEQKRSRFRCLKDRYTGQATGKVLTLCYDPETGLQHVDPDWEWPGKGKTGKDYGFTNQNQQHNDF